MEKKLNDLNKMINNFEVFEKESADQFPFLAIIKENETSPFREEVSKFTNLDLHPNLHPIFYISEENSLSDHTLYVFSFMLKSPLFVNSRDKGLNAEGIFEFSTSIHVPENFDNVKEFLEACDKEDYGRSISIDFLRWYIEGLNDLATNLEVVEAGSVISMERIIEAEGKKENICQILSERAKFDFPEEFEYIVIQGATRDRRRIKARLKTDPTIKTEFSPYIDNGGFAGQLIDSELLKKVDFSDLMTVYSLEGFYKKLHQLKKLAEIKNKLPEDIKLSISDYGHCGRLELTLDMDDKTLDRLNKLVE